MERALCALALLLSGCVSCPRVIDPYLLEPRQAHINAIMPIGEMLRNMDETIQQLNSDKTKIKRMLEGEVCGGSG